MHAEWDVKAQGDKCRKCFSRATVTIVRGHKKQYFRCKEHMIDQGDIACNRIPDDIIIKALMLLELVSMEAEA